MKRAEALIGEMGIRKGFRRRERASSASVAEAD